MEGRGEALDVGGCSTNACSERDGEFSIVTKTMLMEMVEAEVGVGFQVEVDGNEDLGILNDTLIVTKAGIVGGDCQVADGLGSKRQEVDGVGPCGPQKTLDLSLMVGRGLLSKLDPLDCRKWLRVSSFCFEGIKPNSIHLNGHLSVGSKKRKQRKGESVALRVIGKKLKSKSNATDNGFTGANATPEEFSVLSVVAVEQHLR